MFKYVFTFLLSTLPLRADIVQTLSAPEALAEFKADVEKAAPEHWAAIVKKYQAPVGALSIQSLNNEPAIGSKVRMLRSAESNLAKARRLLNQSAGIIELADNQKHSERLTKRLERFRTNHKAFVKTVAAAEAAYLNLLGTVNERLTHRWRERIVDWAARQVSARLMYPDRSGTLAKDQPASSLKRELEASRDVWAKPVAEAEKEAEERAIVLRVADTQLIGAVAGVERAFKTIRTLPFVENSLMNLQSDVIAKVDQSQPNAGSAIDAYYRIRVALANTDKSRAKFEAEWIALKKHLNLDSPDEFERLLKQ